MNQRTSPPLPVCVAAEALGTLLLVTAVVGSGIMAERSTNDAALALLANTLSTAAILVVLVTIFAPVSGAHLNPAVSLVFAIRGELPAKVLALYVVAQVLGGIVGTVLAHLMFDVSPLVAGIRARTGLAQWLAEFVATFSLVIAILGGLRFRAESVPWLVGLTIASAYRFTASTSFANPAPSRAHLRRHSLGLRPAMCRPSSPRRSRVPWWRPGHQRFSSRGLASTRSLQGSGEAKNAILGR